MSRSNPTWLERFGAEVYMALNGSEAPDEYDDGVHAHHDAVIRNYGKTNQPKPKRPIEKSEGEEQNSVVEWRKW